MYLVLDCHARVLFETSKPTSRYRKALALPAQSGRSLGKTNALNDDDLKEFVKLQTGFADSEKSWTVDVADIDKTSFELSMKNSNAPEEAPLRDPEDILDGITALDKETAELLEDVRKLVSVKEGE